MSSYAEGQVHQLMNALEAAGWKADDLTKLGQYPRLGEILSILHGHSEVVVRKRVIDLSADPFLSDGWRVEKHWKQGKFEWDPNRVRLHLSPNQMDGKCIEGNKLRKELEGKQVLNANVLDYLLVHPELIPEDWKSKCIFFWGTIYRNSDGNLFVHYLDWDGKRWHWDFNWLDGDWCVNDPALVLAE